MVADAKKLFHLRYSIGKLTMLIQDAQSTVNFLLQSIDCKSMIAKHNSQNHNFSYDHRALNELFQAAISH